MQFPDHNTCTADYSCLLILLSLAGQHRYFTLNACFTASAVCVSTYSLYNAYIPFLYLEYNNSIPYLFSPVSVSACLIGDGRLSNAWYQEEG